MINRHSCNKKCYIFYYSTERYTTNIEIHSERVCDARYILTIQDNVVATYGLPPLITIKVSTVSYRP